LRQQENIKNTYFILMSAKRDMDWILPAKKARADGLITKPFTPEMLKQKISQLGATHALAWPAPSQAGPPDHIWGGSRPGISHGVAACAMPHHESTDRASGRAWARICPAHGAFEYGAG
jgi:DNA-binding response OmpR family regulator